MFSGFDAVMGLKKRGPRVGDGSSVYPALEVLLILIVIVYSCRRIGYIKWNERAATMFVARRNCLTCLVFVLRNAC